MLNEKDLSHTASIIWQLQQPVSSEVKRKNVLSSLSELLNSEFIASYVFDKNRQKSRKGVALNIDQASIDKYNSYQYSDDIVTPIASM